MEKENWIYSRFKTSSLKISELICTVPFKLSFYGHSEQANNGAEHQSKRKRYGDIFVSPGATSKAGVK